MRNRSLAAHKSMQKLYTVYTTFQPHVQGMLKPVHEIRKYSDIEWSIEVARCRTMQLWDMINCRVASQQPLEKSLLLRWHSAGDGSWYWTCTRQRFAELHQNKNKFPPRKHNSRKAQKQCHCNQIWRFWEITGITFKLRFQTDVRFQTGLKFWSGNQREDCNTTDARRKIRLIGAASRKPCQWI